MINDLKKIFTTADIILILFLISVVVFMVILIKDDISAKQVGIRYHNKFVVSAPLNKDKIIEIDEGIVAEIKDGKVRIKESTCKNNYCVKQGWNNRFPIICVPNEVSLVIKSKKKEEMLITR